VGYSLRPLRGDELRCRTTSVNERALALAGGWHNALGGRKAARRPEGDARSFPATDCGEVDMASPAVRLLGFLLLLAIMFAGAFAVGARLGPVELTHAPRAPGGTMHMSSGSGPAADRFQVPGSGRR